MKDNWVSCAITVIIVFISLVEVKGQTPVSGNRWINTLSIGITGGFLSFQGDIGTAKAWSSKVFMPGFGLNVEKRAGSTFGFSLNLLSGKISENNNPYEYNYNFRSSVFHADIRGIIHLDNGIIMKEGALFAPFASIGLGYLKFSPAADLKDKSGNPYYYWSDRSIRTEKEDGNNHDALITARDYEYETTLEYSFEDSASYRRHTYTVPLTAGINMNMTSNFSISVFGTLYLTGTDFLDNFKGDSRKDKFLYTGMAVRYSFNGKKSTKPLNGTDKFGVPYSELYADVSWKLLDQSDYDGDGVVDIIDDCPQTPEGLVVYKNGCPLDDDSDGIPNYRDKELQTAAGVNVNTYGEELIDSIMYFQYLVRVDSLAEYMPETYRKRLAVTRAELTARKFYSIRLYSFKLNHDPQPALIEQIKTLGGYERQLMENGSTVYTYGAYVTGKEAIAIRKKLIMQGFSKNISVVKYVPFSEQP